ncbi:MAG TPA: LptF/LptG family permease, partial [Acidobacteriota bacterium]|nr:LptF/LptG family permease [Acidobacteriota bacterium]
RVREKDIGELVRDLAAIKASSPDPGHDLQARVHRIEIHKKFALSLACLVLALLGLPLGLLAGRGGRTGGFSFGLVIILVYYALLTAGETFAVEARLSPFLAMWGPDIILALAAALLLIRPVRPLSFLRSGRRGAPVTASGASRLAIPSVPAPSAAAAIPAAVPALRPRSRPLRFPGLIDLYVSRKFLALLALVFAALAAAAFLLVFFEHLSETLARAKPVGLLVRYAGFKLPELLAYLLPAAVLAAALLTLGFLARTNEATALKACGISAYRTALPVLVLAAAASLMALAIQERVVPAAAARSEAAWTAINDLPPRSSSYLNRRWILGRSGDRIYRSEYFDPGSGTFGRLSVLDIEPGRWALARRFFAEKAVFDGEALAYQNGWTRDFTAGPAPAFSRSASGRILLAGDKASFLEPSKEPPQMTLAELGRYAGEVRAMGFPDDRLRAELARKKALPFVSLIMALLAVPFGFRMGRKGTLVGVGLSIAVAMAYWGAFAIFRSLGSTGTLTPFLSAWGASLLFGLAGVVGIFRLRT